MRMSDTSNRLIGPDFDGEQLCAQADPDAFFPPEKQADAAGGQWTIAAKRICAACPVRARCLEYALQADERDGVWGGMSPTQRRYERRRRGITSRSPQNRAALAQQIHRLRRDGLTDRDIAFELNLAERTVRRYLQSSPSERDGARDLPETGEDITEGTPA